MLVDVDFSDNIEISMPHCYSWSDAPCDGLGGPPVDDPGTLDVIFYDATNSAELIYRTTLISLIDTIIDMHKIPSTNKIGCDGEARVCLEIAQAMKDAAARLESACESPA
jgi:hypothetical protein